MTSTTQPSKAAVPVVPSARCAVASHEMHVFSPPPVVKEGLGVVRFWL